MSTEMFRYDPRNLSKEEFERTFPVVDISKVSIEDEFLKHEPKSFWQEIVKREMIKALKNQNLKNFRCPIYDPSFDCFGDICYMESRKPGLDKSCLWWYKKFRDFLPSKNSRMGTDYERYAWSALLMKYLIEEEGYTIAQSWEAVCDDSSALGNWKDSNNRYENTGSRPVGQWFDLGNTGKITVTQESGFLVFGGGCYAYGHEQPLLKSIERIKDPGSTNYFDLLEPDYLGWLVMDV